MSLARDNMHAPELYEDEIRRYCSYKNLQLARIYSDVDYSAFRGAKARPSLNELIDQRAQYSAVVVPKLSRFGRSMKELVRLFEIFDNDGIPLVFLDMNLDTSSSQGRLLRHILAAFAEYESDVKADYSRANQRMIAQAGRPHGDIAPFGYIRIGRGRDATYGIDEARAPILIDMFERYAAGASLGAIARYLDERGIIGLRGGRITRTGVSRIFRNPAYVGLRRYKGETFKAVWAPLVDEKLWTRVQARQKHRRSVHVVERKHGRGLLRGMFVCGVCGKPLSCEVKTDGLAYRCQKTPKKFKRCGGGLMMASRAEEATTDAMFQILELAADPALRGRGEAIREQWEEAKLDERSELLAEVIDHVELVPQPTNKRLPNGLWRHRSIKIFWTRPWAEDVFGHRGAFSVLSPGQTSIKSPKGKTWARWQKELRAAR